jgi:hypothetical protein
MKYEMAKDIFLDSRFYKLVAFPDTPPETLVDGSEWADVKSRTVYIQGLKAVINHEPLRDGSPKWDI